jgi:hypothetical protein
LLLRGQEFQPLSFDALAGSDAAMAVAVEGSLRVARLAVGLPDALRDHPDPSVRRAAAVLAARAHPLLAAADA